MSKARIIRFLSWFFTICVFVGLGLIYSHCSMQRVSRVIPGGGNSNLSGNPGGGSSRNPDETTDDDSDNGNSNNNTPYCRDNPNAELCGSATPTTKIEEASEAHKDLRGRYPEWVELDNASNRDVEEFLSGINLNSRLDRIRVYFELEGIASGVEHTYGGDIQVLIELDQEGEDAAIKHPVFRSGDRSENKYNHWSTGYEDHSGDLGFRAFFQNQHGAVILVIDDVETKTTDESGRQFLGEGSIWFMQFKSLVGSSRSNNSGDCYAGGRYIGKERAEGASGLPPFPSKKCWLIGTRNPYDCRAPFQNLEPTNSCYRKLGDFERLNLNRAFDLEGDEEFLPGNASTTRKVPVPPLIF